MLGTSLTKHETLFLLTTKMWQKFTGSSAHAFLNEAKFVITRTLLKSRMALITSIRSTYDRWTTRRYQHSTTESKLHASRGARTDTRTD